MATCPHCKKEVGYSRYFGPGGFLKCNHCQSMISKKVSNELGMVFLVLLITLPLTWASTYFLMNAFPALKDNDLLPLVQIAIGAPAALLSSWLLWRKWIKL